MLKHWQQLTSSQEWLELGSSCRIIQQPWWTSYFSLMKKSSPLLPLPVHRTTVFTSVLAPERTSTKTDCFAQDLPLASKSWCQSASRSLAALLSILSSLESKWMENTIATTYLDKIYCHADMRWLSQDEFFCVSTGWRPRTSGTPHNHLPGAKETRLHTSDSVAAEFARS